MVKIDNNAQSLSMCAVVAIVDDSKKKLHLEHILINIY